MPRKNAPTVGKREKKEAGVIDFGSIREKKLEEKRRKTERILFKHIVGVYCVTDTSEKLNPIELIDVSDTGCSFIAPFQELTQWESLKKPFIVRLYFSQDTYIPVQFEPTNVQAAIVEGQQRTRVGCKVKSDGAPLETYRQFVKFLKSYSENARRDDGTVSFFYL